MSCVKRLLTLLPVLICFVALSIQAAESEYRYEETTGDKITVFTWNIQGQDPVTITSFEPGKSFKNICRTDGAQVEWEFRDDEKQNRIRVVRNGRSLSFKATLEGKSVEKTEELDEDPWFQALSYSLRQWLQSDRDSVKFWMVKPDDLEMHKLQAERAGVETLKTSNGKIKAHRVKVRLTGAMSFFWHVTYWFRADDFLLVRYEGVHGPPGTPKTVIRLLPDSRS